MKVVSDADGRSPVTAQDLLRTVAAMSPGGEWVAATEVARRLDVQLPDLAAQLKAAIEHHWLVEQDMRDGIWWVRNSLLQEPAPAPERRARRPSTGQPGQRVARPAKPPPPPKRA